MLLEVRNSSFHPDLGFSGTRQQDRSLPFEGTPLQKDFWIKRGFNAENDSHSF
jgi:hypothetical protein